MKNLNLIVRTLNESGWHILDARLETATCVDPASAKVPKSEFCTTWGGTTVTLAVVESGYLSLTLNGRDVAGSVLLMANLIDVRVEGDPFDVISIYGPKVREEQAKKMDGGGTRHVPYDGLILKIIHRERFEARLEAKRRADEAARAQARAEAEARRREEDERRDAERRASVRAAFGSLLANVRGTTIEDIVPFDPFEGGTGFIITFSNGRRMRLEATTEDYYGADLAIDLDGKTVVTL